MKATPRLCFLFHHNGKAGKGGGLPLNKEERQQEQRLLKDAKVNREIEYFWHIQEVNKNRKSRPQPRPDQEAAELWPREAVQSVGIDFDKYQHVQVEISGQGSEQVKYFTGQNFSELSQCFNFPPWLKNCRKTRFKIRSGEVISKLERSFAFVSISFSIGCARFISLPRRMAHRLFSSRTQKSPNAKCVTRGPASSPLHSLSVLNAPLMSLLRKSRQGFSAHP